MVLSACETGIVEYKYLPDEFVGFPAAFIQAGAAGVISSLWTVEDKSRALLMSKFCSDYIANNENSLLILQEAQLWIRDATREEIFNCLKQSMYVTSEDIQTYAITLIERFGRLDTPYSHPFYWAAFTYHGI